MKATLLSIGDELALGQTVDTNTAWVAAELATLGIHTLQHVTVADNQVALVRVIREAAAATPLVIASGGLGPTADDLTRFALAEVLGEALVTDDDAVAHVRSFFERIGRPMPESNTVQAQRPVSAAFIANPVGTAPGLLATVGSATCFFTPGVPSEMKRMFADHVRPWVVEQAAAAGERAPAILTTKIDTFGLGESEVSEKLGTLMARDRNPTVGTTVSGGLCSVRIRSENTDAARAEAELEETAQQVEAAVGDAAFGRNGATLEAAVQTLLIDGGHTVATAESCTGGQLAARLTANAGSSACMLGGWVVYSNAMKTSQLGVDTALLAEHGAVSAPVAEALARGARERSGADFALSTTGIAGPGGGTDAKPVGTVWIALATAAGVTARRANLNGSRDRVQDRSVKCALQMLRYHLLGRPLEGIHWLSTAEVATA